MKIKLKAADELKIIKAAKWAKLPVKQVHKNKKAYSRRDKYKLILDL